MGDFSYTPANGTKVELNTQTFFEVEYTKYSGYNCEVTLMLCTSSGKILREQTETRQKDSDVSFGIVPATFGEYVSNDGAPSYLTFSGWFAPPGNPDYHIVLTDVPRYPVVQYKECGAPTSVTVSSSTVAPGASVKLSWSGAYYGADSGISGYEIYRATSVDGTYSLLTTVSSTGVSGSTTVVAPTTENATYYYKVKTISATSGKDSDISTAYASLTAKYTAVRSPNTVTVEPTNVRPNGEAQLSWKNAAAGNGNAITKYEIYRASVPNATDEEYELLTTVTTSATSGSVTVTAPSEQGNAYYYKVKAFGTLTDLDGTLSAAYAMLTCTFSAPSAPNKVTLDRETSAYVLPDTKLLLEWSGASDGANNSIVGYRIYRDGEVYVDNLEPTVSNYYVESNGTSGASYRYTVMTLGEYEDGTESEPCVAYTYTHPTAPKDVVASDSMPPAGSQVSLSWSNAEAGGFNEITGYRVFRSAELDGVYTQIMMVVSTKSSDSCLIDAPPVVGYSYYYRVETVGSRSVSGQSSAYATITSIEATAPEEDTTVIITPKLPCTRRKMVFGDYDTDIDGRWILSEWAFSEPETQTNYVEVPGRSGGTLDLSTYLTGGDPRYGSRELSARFEGVEGTRLKREDRISDMVNQLHGQRVDIVLPDDPERYITGRLSVVKEFNTLAYASVNVSAVCDPWRYSKRETRFEIQAFEVSRDFVLSNAGRRMLVPTVTVTGYDALVHLVCGDRSWDLTAGEYRLPELVLRSGNTTLSCSGSGVIAFTYREAVL